MKALGRCARKHVAVVQHEAGVLPAGACGVETCKGELVEWAVKNDGDKARGVR